ncbi:TM2 domain-containing protein [Streptomyces sp. 6N223]|uniref:TM2 domain-containing protein n=1 Tax=Streptomyces sp. 6N223 TaxID=3457412 RepID=UPI003FD6825C
MAHPAPSNPYLQPKPREMSMAYILWLLAGAAGAHRWYLGRKGSAKAMTILACTIVGLLVSIPWSWVDAFLIPGITREENAKLAEEWETGTLNRRAERESAEGGL